MGELKMNWVLKAEMGLFYNSKLNSTQLIEPGCLCVCVCVLCASVRVVAVLYLGQVKTDPHLQDKFGHKGQLTTHM